MATDGGVGALVAEHRRGRGLTQAQLAQRAHVSVSLVRKVEQGVVPASPSFVAAAARGLGVNVPDLLHQPVRAVTRADRDVLAVVPALRRELACYLLPADDGVAARPLVELRRDVEAASRLRHRAELAALGAVISGLLADLRAASSGLRGRDCEELYGLRAEAYAAAGQVAYKLGHVDLATLTTERVEWAAVRSGDPLAVAAADFYRAGELIGSAEWSGARTYLDGARRRVEHGVRAGEEAALAMWGQLHLKAGLAAARAGDRAGADEHLAEAQDVARRVRPGSDHYRLAFDADGVQVWAVGLAVEAGDGTTAVSRATTRSVPATTSRERLGHYWIDLARGYLLHGDRDRSLTALLEARRVAPQQTRHHPMATETVRALVRSARRRSDSVSGFASWLGIGA